MRFKGVYRIELNNSLDFVKIISLKNANFDLALRMGEVWLFQEKKKSPTFTAYHPHNWFNDIFFQIDSI